MRSLINAAIGPLATTALALASAIAVCAPSVAAPNVVVTIAPIHSLVAGVMAGVAAPRLLIDGAQSPHGFQLKPSDARALAAADLIVEVGAGLERFLDKPLDELAQAATLLSLADVDGMNLLPYGDDAPAHEAASGTDPHLWLDPENGRIIVAAVAATLSKLDPDNGSTYAANATALDQRLAVLDAVIDARLQPVREKPYIVFHDGYRYLEAHYRLAPAVPVTVNPELQPGAGHLREVKAMIAAQGVRCIFVEPQFTPKLAKVLAAEAGLHTAVLDPIGAGLTPGPELYFELMQRNAAALGGCLGAD